MSAQLTLPASLPLNEEKGLLLARLVEGLDSHALWWLSGYSAGLAGNQGGLVPVSAPARAPSPGPAVTVLYGSQTGNAKRLAEGLAADLEQRGAAVRLLRADAYPTRELKNERQLYLVISTQGDGDPPDDSRGLFEFLAGKRAPALDELRFAVLGLGDSSYPQFNAVARTLDARLAELGGKRLFALGEADVDVDSVAKPWLKQALEHLPAAAPLASVVALRPHATAKPRHDRNAPFSARLLANQRITGRDSDRDVRHLELDIEGAGFAYEPGDALGVWPRNALALVDELLEALELDGDAIVSHGDESLPLREWLGARRELTRLNRPFIATHAALAGSAALNRLLAPEQAIGLAGLLASHQLIDLVRSHPANWGAAELVAALRPLTPRLYSIASSRTVVGEEAHLTVAHVDYQAFGFRHQGVASGFLARLDEDGSVPVFLEANERFRLPADGSRDIIMIGPGTGVAPFRGFVQERAASGASGRNWLLFGNPHFRSDFLYQVEWQEALREGRLDRLDLAFSRDQAEKVYVQHRLREHAHELYAWLANGAHLYVCGDASRMANDVEQALVDIHAAELGGSRERAVEAVEALRSSGRYARDVY